MLKRVNRLTAINFAIIFIFIILIQPLQVESALRSFGQISQKDAISSIHIPFLKNNGQVKDESVRYYSKTFGGPVFITTKGEVVYCLFNRNGSNENSVIVLKERFGDAKSINPQAFGLSNVKVRYFKGRETNKLTESLSAYEAINFGEISPGIELTVKSTPKNIEKYFYVMPGADPSKITVKVDGANDLKVNSKGELVINTNSGAVGFSKPIAYQEIKGVRSSVHVEYIAINREYRFKLGQYNKSYKLIIDPLLSSTFIGGGASDEGRSICTDQEGNVLVVGSTESVDFPSTQGVYKTSNNGAQDIYISKFDSDLKTLLATTYFGGSNDDLCRSVALDSKGNVIITGVSNSDDFPITQGTFTPNPIGAGTKIYVAKFDKTLQNLLSSAYIGAVNDWQDEYCDVLSIDNNDNIIVTGTHPTSGFSTDTSIEYHWIDYCGFVAKLNNSLTNLLAAKVLDNCTYSACIDSMGNILIAGAALGENSTDDVYVTKFDPNLQTQLGEITFGGGNGDDYATTLLTDDNDNVFVAGNTNSSDFPVTQNVFDETYNDDGDIFFAKLDPDLNEVQIATYIGTENMMGSEGINSMKLNQDGDICGVGFTHTQNWPVTQNAYQQTGGGHTRGFIIKFNRNLQTLFYSTYLGGDSDHDEVKSISVTNGDYVYISGNTRSDDFPVTSDAYDNSYNLEGDVFVAKLNLETSALLDNDISEADDGDGGGNDDGGNCFINSLLQ